MPLITFTTDQRRAYEAHQRKGYELRAYDTETGQAWLTLDLGNGSLAYVWLDRTGRQVESGMDAAY